MGILWGPWSSDGRFRAGVQMTQPTAVGAGTPAVNVYAQAYLQSRYSLSENNFGDNWFINGSMGASGQTNYSLGAMGVVLMGQVSRTINTSYTGTARTSVTVRIHRNASPGAGGNASVSASLVTAQRPYTVPAAVGAINAVRNSDAQATVTWVRNATTGAPYTSQTIQMRTFTGSSYGPWVNTANVSANATSYVRTGLSANHVYQFGVRANNTVGSSGFVQTQQVWMTPSPPTNVDSSLDASGTSITTTWTNQAYIAVPPVNYYIQRSVAGGAWTLRTSTASGESWTDSSPGAGVNQYRVAVASPTSLISVYVTADPISTIVPPLAPTLLNPNGTSRDLTLDQTWTWKHNSGGDKAKQSHYQTQYSTDAGATWTALAINVASTVSAFMIAGGTLTNGVTYLWRVSTQGIPSATFGPYSAPATVTGSTTPTITFDPAHPSHPTIQLPLDTQWVYQQDEGSPQTAWEAELWHITFPFDVEQRDLVERQSGTDETGIVWAYPVIDGEQYFVRVRARSGAGIWSNYAETSTTITLPTPAAANIDPEFDPCTGVMILHITADDPVDPLIAVQYVVIERRVAGGDWVVLSDYFEPDGDFIDLIPLTHGMNEYRLTSVSAAPSYFVNPVVEAPGLDGAGGEQWVLIAYGDGFTNVLRFHGDPKVTENAGRASAAQPLLGRGKPLAMFGQITNHELDVGGSLFFDTPCTPVSLCGFDSPPVEWVVASQVAEVVCYRDYTGRRLFGFISGLGVTDGVLGAASLGFHFTETEFADKYGSALPVEGV